MVYDFSSRMSMCPKSTILVVLMFGHAVSDLDTDYNITDWDPWTNIIENISDWDPWTNFVNIAITLPPPIQVGAMGPGIPQNIKPVPPSEKGCYYPDFFIPPGSNESGPYDVWDQLKNIYGYKNTSGCNNPKTKSESARRWREISEEAELFLTGRMSTVLIPSFYTLVFIISVPLNICAVLVFVRRIKPKNPAVIFMLNLACADLLFAAVLPFKISYHFNSNNWIFGPAMCRLVTAAFFWNMYCSVLLIACISVDRLLAVVYPMGSLTWRSNRKAAITCIAMWILSFTGSLHIIFTEQTVSLEQLKITTCHDIQPLQLFECYKMYFITLCFLLFFLPLVIMAVSYTRVIMTLSKAQPGVPDHDRKKRRAVVLATTVLVMFVICFTPTNCLFIVHLLMYTEGDAKNKNNADTFYIVYQVFLCLGSLNCLLDPLVYYFGSSHFQKELSNMLGRQKTTQGTSSGQSSSNPTTTTSQTASKSNCKEGSTTKTLLINSDSSQAKLCSHCKRNLV